VDTLAVRRLTLLGTTFPLAGPALRPDEDPELVASLAVAAVQISLPWGALVPRAGALSSQVAESQREVVQAMRARGLAVWVALLDGDPPGWFLDDGGFADPKTAGRWWPRFVETATEVVGDLVDGWVPMLDPVGYGRRTETDPLRHATVQRQLVVSWRDAWRVLRGGPPVATGLGLGMVRPADQTVEALQAARERDHLVWRTWLRALRDGTLVVPGLADLELADLDGALDVVGARFRAPRDVEPDRWADDLATMLRRLAEDGPADLDLHVSLALPHADEARRRHLVEASLAAIDDAVSDGLPVRAVWAVPAIGEPSSGALADADRVPSSVADLWTAFARS
jgi:hypothetical protein